MRRDIDVHLKDEPGGALMRLLDGDLPARERARVEEHVRGCARCARELRLYGNVVGGLARLPRLSPPPSLSSRILAAVEAERERSGATAQHPAWAGILGTVYATGALVVFGIATALAGRADLATVARAGVSTLVSDLFASFVALVDRLVLALSAAVRFGETIRDGLGPLAPLWRSVELLAAQPDLRAGTSLALVLTILLGWFIAHRRIREPGRIHNVAFI